MVRGCVIDFWVSWEDYLPFAEFMFNNNFQFSIQMATYEALYGFRCRTLLCWKKLSKCWVLGSEVVSKTKKHSKVDSRSFESHL